MTLIFLLLQILTSVWNAAIFSPWTSHDVWAALLITIVTCLSIGEVISGIYSRKEVFFYFISSTNITSNETILQFMMKKSHATFYFLIKCHMEVHFKEDSHLYLVKYNTWSIFGITEVSATAGSRRLYHIKVHWPTLTVNSTTFNLHFGSKETWKNMNDTGKSRSAAQYLDWKVTYKLIVERSSES